MDFQSSLGFWLALYFYGESTTRPTEIYEPNSLHYSHWSCDSWKCYMHFPVSFPYIHLIDKKYTEIDNPKRLRLIIGNMMYGFSSDYFDLKAAQF